MLAPAETRGDIAEVRCHQDRICEPDSAGDDSGQQVADHSENASDAHRKIHRR